METEREISTRAMDLIDQQGRLSSGSKDRVKSTGRMHYEAQVQVIKKQLGSLDMVRESLGLSQRRMCQLLMVDPSAWTRWQRPSEDAPPHIYRALQWYMTLKEKIPGLTPQYFIGKDPEILHQQALQKIQAEGHKRQEFEEAFSQQSIGFEAHIENLENQTLALRDQNRQLELINQNLKAEIHRVSEQTSRELGELKKSLFQNRIGFGLVAFGSLILSGLLFWKLSSLLNM